MAPLKHAEIELRGVSTHNLKAIDLDLPIGALIAVSGPSGAGKSSLVFDTLFAEGMRRYIETFSARARRSLDRIEKPPALRIDSVPAAVAVKSERAIRGDAAELAGIRRPLAIIFSALGERACVHCSREIGPRDPEAASLLIESLPEDARYMIAFPMPALSAAEAVAAAAELQRAGFLRYFDRAEVHEIAAAALPEGRGFDVIVDRLKRGADPPARRIESLETAFRRGAARCSLIVPGKPELRFDANPRCPYCGHPYQALDPGSGELDLGLRIAGTAAGQVLAFEARAALDWSRNLEQRTQTLRNIHEQVGRLTRVIASACGLGLGRVRLDAGAESLSLGERKRLRLAGLTAGSLVNTLLAVDDPSEGMHPFDLPALVENLTGLRDAGNTVIVITNDIKIMSKSDYVVDLGPGAGEHGGEVVYAGPWAGLAPAERSASARFLDFDYKAFRGVRHKRRIEGEIAVLGVSGRGLRNVEIRFPRGVLSLIAAREAWAQAGAGAVLDAIALGMSGSGAADLRVREVLGLETVGSVIVPDAEPPARRGGTIVAGAIGVYAEIRRTFAATREAKIRGYKPASFSFRMEAGRCSVCKGLGAMPFDMSFLADVEVPCPACGGKRFKAEVLEVKHHDRDIAEALDLTAREAFAFFRNRSKVQLGLKGLIELGLDYLRLGQPTAKLSLGEARRLRLAEALSRRSDELRRNVSGPGPLLLLNNPTAGLHPADVIKLIEALDNWLDGGGTIVAVDCHPLFAAAALWVIELFEREGAVGGCASGSPEALAKAPESALRSIASWLAEP